MFGTAAESDDVDDRAIDLLSLLLCQQLTISLTLPIIIHGKHIHHRLTIIPTYSTTSFEPSLLI